MNNNNFDALWESLTLANDFLFGKIMSNEELCTEMIRRILPKIKIGRIKFTQTQKASKQTLDTRGVRFDVYAKSSNKKIFSVEIQTTDKKDLPRRTRAYHIINGLDALNKNTVKRSGKYNDLPDIFVIFICTFDPFRQGRHIYSFSNVCEEDSDLKLNDGTFTIFLNTEGTLDDVSPELKAFLDFTAGRKSNDDAFIAKLEQSLYESKQNSIWRRELMLLLSREQEKFAEGREQGIAEGREQGRTQALRSIFEKLIAEGMSQKKAAEITGITI